jgi:hypothetical protein
MSIESSMIKGILKDFLPPWSERVGIPPDRTELAAIFPDRISIIPMDLAPSSSLDGIYIDGKDAPRESRELTGQLETLAPGGIAVMILPRPEWSEKDLKQACDGMGFRILFSSRIQTGKKTRLTPEGLPVPASWVTRFFRAGRLFAFPALQYRSGKGLFVILQKKFSQSITSRSGISVVMLMPEDRKKASQMLHVWDSFLREKNFDEVQLVYVEDSPLDPPVMDLHSESVQRVDHYRPVGAYACLRSGLAFSRGRKVIVDFSRGTVSPSVSMPLLDRFIQEEKNLGKSHFVVQGLDYRMRMPYGWFKRFVLRFIAGTVYPDAPIRIYPGWSAALLADLQPAEIKKNPLLLSMALKQKNGKFLNERLNVSTPDNALGLSILSMLKTYLRFRTEKLLAYILLSALALSTLPLLDSGLTELTSLTSNLSLEWMMAGSAFVASGSRSVSWLSGIRSATDSIEKEIRERVPVWQNKLRQFIRGFAKSRPGTILGAAIKLVLSSQFFYLLNALIIYGRPGRKQLIILTYFLHTVALCFIVGIGLHTAFLSHLVYGLGRLEVAIASLWHALMLGLLEFLPGYTLEGQRSSEGLAGLKHGLPPLFLWFLGAIELASGFLCIWLFRRKRL